MNEWHVFTKDGEELTGPNITFDETSVRLFRHSKTKVTPEVRDWKSLWFRRKNGETYYEYDRIYDYIIPTPEVKKVERWDGDTKKEK